MLPFSDRNQPWIGLSHIKRSLHSSDPIRGYEPSTVAMLLVGPEACHELQKHMGRKTREGLLEILGTGQ